MGKINNVMVDLETLSTNVNALIVSLGAVKFDRTGPKEKLMLRFDIENQKNLGRHISMDTLKWWFRQSDAARSALFSDDAVPAPQALIKLTQFLGDNPTIWASPATFDEPRLNSLYTDVGIKVPWSHRNIRDLRTIKAIIGGDWKNSSLELEAHNPVDDCLYQIDELIINLPSLSFDQVKNLFFEI